MGLGDAKKIVGQVRKLQEMMNGTVNPAARECSPVLADLAELVTEATAFLQPLSPKIKVRARIGKDLPEIYADPDQIQQMIVNLYDNSAEAFAESPEGTGTIDIDVVWKPNESEIVIVYADDGPGIPDDIAPRIFEMGFTTKQNAEGTGLAKCRTVAENHGGEIVCRPTETGGVLFSIRIPVQQAPP